MLCVADRYECIEKHTLNAFRLSEYEISKYISSISLLCSVTRIPWMADRCECGEIPENILHCLIYACF